jgi:hypothetical protein
MRRTAGLLVVLWFAVGCGVAAPRSETADDSQPVPKADLPDAKAQLERLEKDIAAREKDLADLKAEADALRKRIAATEKKDKQVFRSPAELFADLPKDKYPKARGEGAAERAVCTAWLKKNVVGRVIEWKGKVGQVEFEQRGELCEVLIYTKQYQDLHYLAFGDGKKDGIKLGPEQVEVLLDRHRQGSEKTSPDLRDYPLRYVGVTGETATKMRDLKGKEVVFQAKILLADVSDTNVFLLSNETGKIEQSAPITRQHEGLIICLTITPPTLNGFDPTARK